MAFSCHTILLPACYFCVATFDGCLHSLKVLDFVSRLNLMEFYAVIPIIFRQLVELTRIKEGIVHLGDVFQSLTSQNLLG